MRSTWMIANEVDQSFLPLPAVNVPYNPRNGECRAEGGLYLGARFCYARPYS